MGADFRWAAAMDVDRFVRATQLAATLHRDQLRKGTQVPYLAHLLGVAALVAEDEGSEDAVLAALLHDAAEDQGGEETLRLIAHTLGDQVSALVRECSDSLATAQADKAPWRERKQHSLDELVERSAAALLIIAADKLHNVRATAADLRLVGPSVWSRFKTGRDGFVWYHEEMATRLIELAPRSRSARLLLDETDALSAQS